MEEVKSMYEDLTHIITETEHEHREKQLKNSIKRLTDGIKIFNEGKVTLGKIENCCVKFKVKSSGIRVYDVILEHGQIWTCECPDHEFRLSHCKHIYAAIFFLHSLKSKTEMR